VSAILNTVLPVFSLIVLGFIFARAKIIDAAAGRGISLFVFNVAIPALLFKTVATLPTDQGTPWALWFAYFGGIALVWIMAAIVSRSVSSLDHSGGAVAAMAASFGNLALLGTPLALAHFGEAAAIPLGLILSVHAATLWLSAMLHRSLARSAEARDLKTLLLDLLRSLASNAIVIGLLAGTLWRFLGLGLHPIPEKILSMLAEAGVPTALFALGVSLAAYALKGSWSGMLALIGLKMALMPLVVWGLATFVVTLPPLWIKVAVLFAAMPTGANAFLFAQQSEEAVPAVSGAIALGTALAAITCALLLWLMDSNMIGPL
jgi:malonate transporter and related proteins